jgi:hypothetical protein
VRVVGTVRDLQTSGPLPGVAVEVVGAGITAVTDVDGRYILDLVPGKYTLKTEILGFQERQVDLTVEPGTTPTVDVAMALQSYAESVTVVGQVDAAAASAEAQLVERKNAPVITDNLGAEDMKANADGDAAAAMSRVTGISVVDNQYVYVRGLGERYSNTTLSGAVVPSTEPDKKVVALDLFPAGLLDSVQIAKSFSPDRSAEFAGGLVQIRPVRLPSRRLLEISVGARSCAAASTARRSATRARRSPRSAASWRTGGGRRRAAASPTRTSTSCTASARGTSASWSASASRTRRTTWRRTGASSASATMATWRR